MIYYKTNDEIELIRISSLLVSETLAYAASLIKPGITSLEIDRKAEEFIRDNGGIPSFKGYKKYPASLCISMNDEVVHGLPSKQEVKEGDIISLDGGVFKNGFHGDSAYTFLVGEVPQEVVQLALVTKEALKKALELAREGNRIGDISYAIQEYCEMRNGYGVVRELVGHGIGKSLHEEPEVPNFGTKGRGPKLLDGLVIAVEPMVNLGVKHVSHDKDGWTIRTRDKKPSVHYEHTVAIRKSGPDVLSSFEPILKAEKQNSWLYKTAELVTN